jgi:hypothetical protein
MVHFSIDARIVNSGDPDVEEAGGTANAVGRFHPKSRAHMRESRRTTCISSTSRPGPASGTDSTPRSRELRADTSFANIEHGRPSRWTITAHDSARSTASAQSPRSGSSVELRLHHGSRPSTRSPPMPELHRSRSPAANTSDIATHAPVTGPQLRCGRVRGRVHGIARVGHLVGIDPDDGTSPLLSQTATGRWPGGKPWESQPAGGRRLTSRSGQNDLPDATNLNPQQRHLTYKSVSQAGVSSVRRCSPIRVVSPRLCTEEWTSLASGRSRRSAVPTIRS